MYKPNIFFNKIQDAKAYIEGECLDEFPTTVFMTGTGLAGIVEELDVIHEISYKDIPHFPQSTVQSHKGSLILGKYNGNKVAVLAGRWHYYEGYTTKEFTLPIRVMKELGAKQILFTNVAGGVNPEHEAGDIVLVTDHINSIPDHPLRGPNDERLGVRFPDMLHTYDKELRASILQSAEQLGLTVKEGVYYALQGPSLETPAEYTMIHRLGADLVGMSTVPEVIVARHCQLKIAALSIVSNVCYPPERITETTIEEVIEVAHNSSKKLNQILLHLLSH